MFKTKITIIIILALLILPCLSQAKSKYHKFSQKQFKIKYDAKIWKKYNSKNFLKLKYKTNQKTIKTRIKRTNLYYNGRQNLKNLKVNKFANHYKDKIKNQFKKLNPMYQYADKYSIKKKTKYKIIVLKYNLYPTGQLNAYYITNKKAYFQFITICKKNNCLNYNQTFKKLLQSFRILKDTQAPTFDGTMNATSASTSSITISWNQASDNNSKPKQIKYFIYQANQLEAQDYASPTYKTGRGDTSYQVDNLQESTSYYFVVRAKDESKNIDQNQTQAIATTKATSNNNPTAGSIQSVTYQSNGSTVLARMYRPNGTGPFPAILYNHGGIGPGDPTLSDTEINQLRQGNTYAVLATAYRGDFGSQGTSSTSIDDVNDVLAAMEYLKSKSYIDSSRIGMWGKSRGGNVTLSAIERTTDSKVTVTWFPYTNTVTFCDYLNNKVPGLCTYYLDFYGITSPAYYARISSPVNFTNRLNTLLQNSHSTDDPTVPYSQSIELNAAMTGKSNYTFYEYTNGGHGSSGPWTDGTALNRMYDYFNSYL